LRRILLVILGVAALFAAATPRAQWKTPWSYDGADGPEHWAALDPAYAACNGREQSPIDIRGAQKASLPPLRFEYERGPLEYLINNGKTVRVNYHGADNDNFLLVGDQRYQLTQFHFHRPSEEYVNGKQHDMVAHLMHQTSDGKVAGVAVLLKTGAANSLVEQLWEHMPLKEGPEHEIPGVQINPAALLPENLSYYSYRGSLTAPPCTEGVTWFVLKTPVTVSSAQINAFAALYPHDVRPLQPLHGRIIQESQ
jgi:carbonic anhydrase